MNGLDEARTSSEILAMAVAAQDACYRYGVAWVNSGEQDPDLKKTAEWLDAAVIALTWAAGGDPHPILDGVSDGAF